MAKEQQGAMMSGFPGVEQMSCGPVSVIRLENCRPSESYPAEDLDQWMMLADRMTTRTLYVDCSNVEFMSSEMLSRLILLQRRMRQRAGKLVLCHVRDEVRRLLAWTKLDRFFDIAIETETEAVLT
jgi:anti-anti-sigma factor